MATRTVTRTTKTASEAENIESVDKKCEKKEVKKTIKKREYKIGDEILCKSITNGELILYGKKSGNRYTWANADDESLVLYEDLQALKVTKSIYLFKPLFIVMDDELVSQWTELNELYSTLLSNSEIVELLNLSPDMLRSNLQKLPTGLLEHIKTIASDLIANETLDSIQRIKVLDEVLNTDFMSFVK